MFQRLFGFRQRARRAVVDALYERIVAASRQPVLYSHWGVPDTPLGRFEMMALHMILFLHRVRAEPGVIRDVAQELTDIFFRDVEHGLRELGIGDLGVPKRIKKLARMFYGRASAYGEALDADDADALALALKRNVMPEAEEWPEAPLLAAYAFEAQALLGQAPLDEFLAGKVTFPQAQTRSAV